MTVTANPALDQLALFARKLARVARAETLALSARNMTVEDKSGSGTFDPVTKADRGAEQAMRRLIEETYPHHGIQGEEFSERPAGSPFTWSLDPIDGTRSYLCGLPTWVTLIGLLKDGEPVLGVIDASRLDEIYVGYGGSASLCRADSCEALAVSNCAALAEARLSTTDPYLFEGKARQPFEQLRRAVRVVRYGHDGYAYARLASGTLDLVVECGLKPHDYNALIPVVRGAGGTFGDWRGGTDFAEGNVIAAATPQLYDAVVAIMRDAR